MPRLSISELLSETEAGLDLELLAGERGLSRFVQVPRIQKPGLALAGYTKNLHPDRIQILGETELSYLSELYQKDSTKADDHVTRLCELDICCLVITKNLSPPVNLLREVENHDIPLLRSHHQSSTFISLLTQYLEERLLPQTNVHGVLVDVLGVGVLLLGKSGIGKSECALDLVIRGHRLVSDEESVSNPAIAFSATRFLLDCNFLKFHLMCKAIRHDGQEHHKGLISSVGDDRGSCLRMTSKTSSLTIDATP